MNIQIELVANHAIPANDRNVDGQTIDVRASMARLEKLVQQAVQSAYPDADVSVCTLYGVEGSIGGATVYDDEGGTDELTAEDVSKIESEVWQNFEAWLVYGPAEAPCATPMTRSEEAEEASRRG